MTHPAPQSTAPKAWWQFSLSQQIMIGLVLGTFLGWWLNGLPAASKATWVDWLVLIRDTFLHLIKAMIAPLVFASVVQGIAGTGDMKKVGRIGGKALLYFEIVTTAALAVGLLVVNFTKPGAGVKLTAAAGSLGAAVQTKPLTFFETILHAFPTSIIDAMAKNDVLQVVVFAVLFAMAVIAAGERGKPILVFCDSLTQVMFQFAGIIMKFAPWGVGGAIAVTVGAQGPEALLNLAKLVLSLYAALWAVPFGASFAIFAAHDNFGQDPGQWVAYVAGEALRDKVWAALGLAPGAQLSPRVVSLVFAYLVCEVIETPRIAATVFLTPVLKRALLARRSAAAAGAAGTGPAADVPTGAATGAAGAGVSAAAHRDKEPLR